MRKSFLFTLCLSCLVACAGATEQRTSETKVASQPQKANCETTNAALEAMPYVSVTLTRSDGSEHNLKARLANNNRTRGAGFQRVCGSTVEETPILFTFRQAQIPSFHMHNVVVPLDIAFIKQSGAVDTIHTMQTYSIVSLSKPLYSPKTPVIAALEVHAGFFNKHGIDRSSKISWRQGLVPVAKSSTD